MANMNLFQLESSEGKIVQVERNFMEASLVLSSLLEHKDASSKTIPVPNVPGKTLEMMKAGRIDLKAFNFEEVFNIGLGADYLGMTNLTDQSCEEIVSRLRNQSNQRIEKIFTGEELGFGVFETEPYTGKDPNLQDAPTFCDNICCDKNEFALEEQLQLKRCSGCHLAFYCSRDCQKISYETLEHKELCLKIKKLKKKIKKFADKCRNWDDLLGEPTNLFETAVGHFWGQGYGAPRDYCRARHQLALEIEHVAHIPELKYMYEMALSHYLELMRLSNGDNQGVRSLVPFTLLKLNRDDDCYNFIKWWETVDHDWDEVPPSNEGDWQFLVGQDKTEDIFEFRTGSDPDKVPFCPLAFLVALLIIKLRMVAEQESKEQQFEAFKAALETSGLCEMQGLALLQGIEERLVGDAPHKALMKKQEEHAERYLTYIHERNPSFLPAVINPKPLRSQPPPQYESRGSPEEAYGVINSSIRILVRIPGAVQRIINRVGENPSYNFGFSQF